MADFQSAIPVEPEKSGDYLHDQSRIPEAPTRTAGNFVKNYGGLIAGILFALGAAVIIFELRDAWESHRDWVPPAALVPAVLGAVALGHLAQRGRINAVAVPVGLFFFAAAGPLLNLWMHHEFPEYDGVILAITIVSAVCMAVAVAWLLIALVLVEARYPTKAPEPQM